MTTTLYVNICSPTVCAKHDLVNALGKSTNMILEKQAILASKVPVISLSFLFYFAEHDLTNLLARYVLLRSDAHVVWTLS